MADPIDDAGAPTRFGTLATAVWILFFSSMGLGAAGASEPPVNEADIARSIDAFHSLNAGDAALQAKAAGMLVFPRVGKGEQPGLNNEHGEGVLVVKGRRMRRYDIQTPTRSYTLGITFHQLVILFMTPHALEQFQQRQRWVIQGDVGMAIVAAGRHGDLNQSELQKPNLGFVYGEEGFFDNLYLEGSTITPSGK